MILLHCTGFEARYHLFSYWSGTYWGVLGTYQKDTLTFHKLQTTSNNPVWRTREKSHVLYVTLKRWQGKGKNTQTFSEVWIPSVDFTFLTTINDYQNEMICYKYRTILISDKLYWKMTFISKFQKIKREFLFCQIFVRDVESATA